MDVRVGLWRRLSAEELMLLNCGVGEDSWESLGLQGDPTSPFWRRSALVFLWREWCWSWNSSTLATSCEELTHWKRLWCWEGLGAGREGDDRGWDGWMASLTRWMRVWVNSGRWWWTGRPGVLRFLGSQRVGHDWATELNWTFPPIAFLSMVLRSTKITDAEVLCKVQGTVILPPSALQSLECWVVKNASPWQGSHLARKKDKIPPYSLESTDSNRLNNESLLNIFPSSGSTLIISSGLKYWPQFLSFVQ